MAIFDMVLECLWFLLPGLLANTSPVFAKKINFLDYPVDFHKKLGGKRVFGSHKTFRGFFFGILTAILIVYLQIILYDVAFFRSISLLDYSKVNFYILGFLFGFGALFGDAVKSFFKRRVGISPGKTWFPFDQIDSVFGVLLLVSFIYVPRLGYILMMIFLQLFLHLFFVYIGYLLKIRSQPI
jgi:CDP-2,3-bis-(O-geranylgeranyl)-sn-glycerol synthase